MPTSAQRIDVTDDLAALLSRMGARVQRYFERAQSIVCDERVYVRPLGYDSGSNGPLRIFDSELRVTWDAGTAERPSPEASVIRHVRTINGRAVEPGEEPGCLDPASISPEPLAMLLPGRREQFEFAVDSTERVDDRAIVTLTYRPRLPGEDEISWKDDCVRLDLPGRTRGRVWADVETGDVLRLDEGVDGMFEFDVPEEQLRRLGGFSRRSMALEMYNSSTRYRPMRFVEPDETLLLPVSVQTMSVWRGAGSRRIVTTQEFSRCRRFVTDARLLDPDAR